MTKPTKEQINNAAGEQLSEWAAEWCMGWTHIDESPLQNFYEFVGPSKTRNPEFYNDYFRVNHKDWQPHLPTEKGKAQAIDLAEKFGLSINFGGKYVYSRKLDKVFSADESWQIAVLKACLYSVIGEE